jgi:hypothetical protein
MVTHRACASLVCLFLGSLVRRRRSRRMSRNWPRYPRFPDRRFNTHESIGKRWCCSIVFEWMVLLYSLSPERSSLFEGCPPSDVEQMSWIFRPLPFFYECSLNDRPESAGLKNRRRVYQGDFVDRVLGIIDRGVAVRAGGSKPSITFVSDNDPSIVEARND